MNEIKGCIDVALPFHGLSRITKFPFSEPGFIDFLFTLK